jgi:hypothetical protein
LREREVEVLEEVEEVLEVKEEVEEVLEVKEEVEEVLEVKEELLHEGKLLKNFLRVACLKHLMIGLFKQNAAKVLTTNLDLIYIYLP